MFRRLPKAPPAPPYKPIHEYTVHVKRSLAWESYTLSIYNSQGERIYCNVFLDREKYAHDAVLPFLEEHERSGLRVDFGDKTYKVVPTHVCEPQEEE